MQGRRLRYLLKIRHGTGSRTTETPERIERIEIELVQEKGTGMENGRLM